MLMITILQPFYLHRGWRVAAECLERVCLAARADAAGMPEPSYRLTRPSSSRLKFSRTSVTFTATAA